MSDDNTGMDPSLLDAIGTLALVLGGTAVAGTTAVVGGVWYGVRRLKRSTRVRRTVDRGSTTMRALTGDSSTRTLAAQRLRVERSLDATRQSLQAAQDARRPLGELPALAAELRVAGESLSQQLRVAEAEPTPEVRAHLAGELTANTERFLRVSADLRAATVTGGHTRTESELDALESRLGVEVDALQAWDDVYGRARRHVERGR